MSSFIVTFILFCGTITFLFGAVDKAIFVVLTGILVQLCNLEKLANERLSEKK